MAPDDKYRVTKYTSARKHATSAGTVSALEVTAIRASYDAYITSIKAGHEEIVESLHSERAEEVEALKKQFAIDIAAVKMELSNERQNAAVNLEAAKVRASRKAKEENAGLVHALRTKISDQTKEHDSLQTSLETTINENNREVESVREQASRLEGRIEVLKKAHAKQLEKMEAKLAVGPNSWIQLHFRGKGRTKARTYFHRYTATLREATKELMKEMSGSDPEDFVFRRGGPIGLACQPKHTLQQVSSRVLREGDRHSLGESLTNPSPATDRCRGWRGDLVREEVVSGETYLQSTRSGKR